MKAARALIAVTSVILLLGSGAVLALNPSLDVSQYAHTSWTTRDGFSLGAIFAMAQTPDGYLWLGAQFGLYRFDGGHFTVWQPPAGQQLPDKPYSLLVTRDGTLWIGTYAGLVSWNGGKLTEYPEIGKAFVTSLLEDRDGTVWAGTMLDRPGTPLGRLCAIRSGRAECYGEDGAFGSFVWSLAEDNSGSFWAGADSGVWRWKPGPSKRYATPGMRVGDLALDSDGRLLIGIRNAGLKRMPANKLEPYPIRSASDPARLLSDRDVDSNKLFQDRDGALWIGTQERGLLHIYKGRTDAFKKVDGLSGDIICSIFEDREGDIWVATSSGLDRFREYAVTTITTKQGLSSDFALSLFASRNGSLWVASDHGLSRWKNGRATSVLKTSGLPGDSVQSLFEDYRGRMWVFTGHGLGYIKADRFVSVPGVPSSEVYSIAGDDAGNLWLSGNKGLSHLRDGRLVEHFPWAALGRKQQAKVVVPEHGGVWLAFWSDGGVLYFKDGHVRASYTPEAGLGKGHVPGLRLDRDGVLWAATEEGGLSRIKDGHVKTLTTRNGLPCDTVHWSMDDDDRSLWLYTACGLVRINRSEVEAWMADPKHRVETTVWDAADGVSLRAVSPGYYGPPVTKSGDGKLWFMSGDGIDVIDPRHIVVNRIPPPVHVEQVIVNHKSLWQNLPVAQASTLRLPPRIRDLDIDYTALSLVAPEKIRFKYKLEGQDRDWKEVVDKREAQYTNLPPGNYRFRVIASNNSGIWNNRGDTLEFSIAPAYYQTDWFRALSAMFFLVLLWAAYQLRVRYLHHEFEVTLEARVGERTRIARDLHDTLLQSAHGVLLRFQTVSQLLPDRPAEAKEKLDNAIEQTAKFVTEARDEVQGLRDSTVQSNDLANAISTLGEELVADPDNNLRPAFRVAVEGQSRNLHPIVRDEFFKIAAEALRNAFRHSEAQQIEVEIRYDSEQFRLRIRDDGKGFDERILVGKPTGGHYGLQGMRERARLIGGKLTVWSKVSTGTEVELCIPASKAYADHRRSWFSGKFAAKA